MESRAILYDKIKSVLVGTDYGDDQAGLILDALYGPVPLDNFHSKLTEILNAYNKDTECNTPDFVLAEFLCMCLEAFKYNIRYRDQTKPTT